MSSTKTKHLRLISVVALGDLGVFLAFATLGKAEHGVALGQALLRTALPFTVSWLAVSPWLGSYRASVLCNLKETVWKIPLIWLLCGLVALFARALLYDRPLNLAFFLVSIGVQGISLIGWRCVLLMVVKRLPHHWKPHSHLINMLSLLDITSNAKVENQVADAHCHWFAYAFVIRYKCR